jgi:hypothetical protein
MFHSRMKRLLSLLIVLVACLGLFLVQRRHRSAHAGKQGGLAGPISPQILSQFTAIETHEQQADETTWASERRAEVFGAVFEELWDQFNNASNRFEVLGAFPIGELLVSSYGEPAALVHQIELRQPKGTPISWHQKEWQNFLHQAQKAGWHVERIEFRQRAFDPARGTEPDRSRFSFRADVSRSNDLERASLEGQLLVNWAFDATVATPTIKRIDATHLTTHTRNAPAPFQQILGETVQPLEKWLFIDPLILYDLDGDGLSEIILAGKNLLYRRRPDGTYRSEPLCQQSPGRIFTAVIADFDGDGAPDFLCAKPEGLILFKGSARGTFDEPGRLVWAAQTPLKYGQFLTCADIDNDGDLDLFLGQYKSPYFHGQMPTPYYNANDADPAYLLLNDGKGNFTDATSSSGLQEKRWRRSYSGSFVRLNGEKNFSLVVVSDFAGIDLYHSDGHGHFRDSTRAAIPDALGFGMGHALSDFNADGQLDFLMIGMDSPAVDRLDYLGLSRPGAPEDPHLRSRLACGNRLLLARAEGGFESTPLSESIARSGWSWGCAAFDFDNDGFPDVYIANGHESRATVRDYDPEFWLHDIFVGGSTNDRVSDLYFQSKFTRTRGRGQSYGGYEQNRFYLNLGAKSFIETAALMGVGLPQDCRNVVADDLDGDGRMDLLVTTFEVWPEPKQTLCVYRNILAETGNWIGFRFHEAGNGKSLSGTSVTIHYGPHQATAQLVTGDSYRCQSANTLHFGLGQASKVDRAEIVWPNGSQTQIAAPAINAYNVLTQQN